MSETIIIILLVLVLLALALLIYRVADFEEVVTNKIKYHLKGLTKTQQKHKKLIDEAILKDMPELIVQQPEILGDFPNVSEVLKKNPQASGLFGTEIITQLIRSAVETGSGGAISMSNPMTEMAVTVGKGILGRIFNREKKEPKQISTEDRGIDKKAKTEKVSKPTGYL